MEDGLHDVSRVLRRAVARERLERIGHAAHVCGMRRLEHRVKQEAEAAALDVAHVAEAHLAELGGGLGSPEGVAVP